MSFPSWLTYASGRAGRGAAALLAADARAGEAAAKLASWDLRGASMAAREAYSLVLAAAAAAEVTVESRSGRDDQGRVGFAAWIGDEATAQSATGLASSTADRVDGTRPAPPPIEPGPDIRPLPPGVELTQLTTRAYAAR